MTYSVVADLLVGLHLAFILFVVGGGFFTWRWPRVAWGHLPAALWGAVIELAGWVCPLTPLEVRFRTLAGEAGYAGGFIEHYLVPIIYPSGLTSSMQVGLGIGVLAINAVAYGGMIRRLRTSQ